MPPLVRINRENKTPQRSVASQAELAGGAPAARPRPYRPAAFGRAGGRADGGARSQKQYADDPAPRTPLTLHQARRSKSLMKRCFAAGGCWPTYLARIETRCCCSTACGLRRPNGREAEDGVSQIFLSIADRD